MNKNLPTLEFILKNYKNFNSRATRDAFIAYWEHLEKGGKMFWAVAGAMSSAQLGITLAPAIKNGLIHGLSVTGANLEESVFRLVAHSHYKDYPHYRYLTKEDDEIILNKGERRVTDTTIPEEEAFRVIEPIILKKWQEAEKKGERFFPHEYFYKMLLSTDLKDKYEGDPRECWLLEAAKKDLPIVVPGWEDSTLGNVFAACCKDKLVSSNVVKTGVEYMMSLYDSYPRLAKDGPGAGFFQIGGGIAGDFPICVVPSIKYDLKKKARPWGYFCQISDSTTSYGSYSGATPNEKITWDKLTVDTPMFVIESDATIVVPLILTALLECKANPKEANKLIKQCV